jgi:hypothetical protein
VFDWTLSNKKVEALPTSTAWVDVVALGSISVPTPDVSELGLEINPVDSIRLVIVPPPDPILSSVAADDGGDLLADGPLALDGDLEVDRLVLLSCGLGALVSERLFTDEDYGRKSRRPGGKPGFGFKPGLSLDSENSGDPDAVIFGGLFDEDECSPPPEVAAPLDFPGSCEGRSSCEARTGSGARRVAFSYFLQVHRFNVSDRP